MNVFGSEFCFKDCSVVTLRLNQRVVGEVEVRSDGTFSAFFTASEVPGQYALEAAQRGPGGSSVSAVHGLQIVPGDAPANSTPTPGTSPGTSPTAPQPGTISPDGQSHTPEPSSSIQAVDVPGRLKTSKGGFPFLKAAFISAVVLLGLLILLRFRRGKTKDV